MESTTAADRARPRPVTVVVPIFDHWDSLERCIQALIAHVDTSIHSVMLVNDCGPNADTLEPLVLEAIDGLPNYSYYRNDTNLGFVGTCNRAVLELDRTGNDVLLLNSDAELTSGALDELIGVLYSAEHHGIVCPRSDQASIATIPYYLRAGSTPNGDRSAEVFAEISPLLPRYYLAPVSIGFCYLVRRSLIDNHGLFDSIFGLGYNEENDFCMRVNALGYSALIANHAFVRHLGSVSFTPSVKAELNERNFRILLDRYPFYMDAVYSFLNYGYCAADVFADILTTPSSAKRSILIDIHHLSLLLDGHTRYALSFLRSLAAMTLPPNISVVVAAQPDAIEFFGLDRYGLTVARYGQLSEVFDVGVALAPVDHVDQLFHLNRFAARWVVRHFYAIDSRATAATLDDPLGSLASECAQRHAQGVVAMSNVALGSTLRAPMEEGADPSDAPLAPEVARVIAASGYLVIAGNSHSPQQLSMALRELEPLGSPIVVFGPTSGVVTSPSTVVVSGDLLADRHLQRIIANASLVVFPSEPEGFGTTIADALYFGVPVVALETSPARKAADALNSAIAVQFFSRFGDLAAIVTAALEDEELHRAAQTIQENVEELGALNKRLIEVAIGLTDEPIDIDALSARFEEVRRVQQVAEANRVQANNLTNQLISSRLAVEAVLSSESYRAGSVLARFGGPVLRVVRRGRLT